ncbi:MAG: diheme cytochrome c [Nitrosomonadales bacterium]|nr:diheme cytochrome c [Nitrosomonadales bacterium]
MKRVSKAVALIAAMLLAHGARAEENTLEWLTNFQRMKEVKPVESKQYREECGSCHFAYQPGLLPARSWEKLLDADALRKHFGENAELDKDTLKAIRDYAIENAADKSWYKRSRKIALSAAEGVAPLRITEVRYIERKHHDIPEKMVKGNKDVKSLSYCDRCHTQAGDGVFDDDTVDIPNYPGWRD